MKYRFAAFPLLLVSTPLVAHDFWIQPFRFQAPAGTAVAMTFLVGHGAARERWGNGADRILVLDDIFAGKRRNIRGDLRSNGPADVITRPMGDGLHIIAMQTTYAASDLPAVRFNDYAKTEGLRLVLAKRERTGETGKPGRERYSRRAKALIQIGRGNAANQALATRAVGLKLEIVPERNPYQLGASRRLPVRIFYKGRTLPRATVKLTNLGNDAKPAGIALTDSNGRAVFRVPPTGDWQLNVVWGEPVTGQSGVDFDTTFSSLTFGYGPGRQGR